VPAKKITDAIDEIIESVVDDTVHHK
jgi:hypothetical protein